MLVSAARFHWGHAVASQIWFCWCCVVLPTLCRIVQDLFWCLIYHRRRHILSLLFYQPSHRHWTSLLESYFLLYFINCLSVKFHAESKWWLVSFFSIPASNFTFSIKFYFLPLGLVRDVSHDYKKFKWYPKNLTSFSASYFTAISRKHAFKSIST